MPFSYPSLSAYLYCLPEHPVKKDASDFKYLSIRKAKIYTEFKIGETIFLLYRKSKQTVPGIIGYCKVAGKLTKVSDINKEDQKLCYCKSSLQLPVSDIECAVSRNIMDEDVLYSLPIMNESKVLRATTECKLIDIFFSIISTLDEHSTFWHIWRAQRTQKEIQEYKELFVHLQREKMDYKSYHKLSKGKTQCQNCGITHNEFLPYTPRFFEFHETNVIAMGRYKKINYENFILLCPNCHKVEHEKMVTQSFIDRSSDYTGYAGSNLMCGWDSEFFIEKFDL